MNITLNLFGKTGFYNQKSVIADKDEKIKIKILTKQLNNVEYFINNKRILNGSFEIENVAGVYDFVISACKNGIEIKKWICEPLIIKELDDKIEAIPEINDFEKRVENKLNEMSKTIEDMASEIKLLHKLVYALIEGE